MTDILRPSDEVGLVEMIAEAKGAGTPVEIIGGGSKRSWGAPVQAEKAISLSGLTGIPLYQPSELVVSAKTGTPLAEVESILAEKGQRLPFEPTDYRGLLGTPDTTPTIGGTVACNQSGPARLVLGAVRDLLLGIRAVNGRAELIRNGGRVMKNVTGYDLAKFAAGSFGTLAALTEVTFKVLPIPERQVTILVQGLSDEEGRAVLSRGLGSPFEVNAAAHLPAMIAARSSAATVSTAAGAVTAMRIEGFADSLTYRLEAIRPILETSAEISLIEGDESRVFWKEVGDATPFAADQSRPVWRLSTAPTEAPGLVATLSETLDVEAYYDWGGGLVWLSVSPDAEQAGADVIHGAVAAVGGHANMIRGPEPVRAAGLAQPPQDPVTRALSRRLKETFDPDRLLNPGRM